MSSITRYTLQDGDNMFVNQAVGDFAVGTFFSTGKLATDVRDSALIFRNISIPRGATINSAYIHMFAFVTQSNNDVKTRFYGINLPNPKPILSFSDFNSRSLTTEYVDWDITSTWTINVEQTSPDLKTIVQAIIDRADWGAGNGLGFLWKDDGSSNDHRRSPSGYNSTTGVYAPFIVIDYTVGAVTRSYTVRCSLAGYNGVTDNDPSHYSLMVDSSHVLIKEFTRGSGTVPAMSGGISGELEINHNLGYVPLVYVYIEDAGVSDYAYGMEDPNDYQIVVDDTTLEINNHKDHSVTARYYIFYDGML